MATASKPSTKSLLLQAGIKEFSAHGFRGAFLRSIAEEAGTNVAAVNYHYASKEKLWQAVVSNLYSKLGKAIMADEPSWSDM